MFLRLNRPEKGKSECCVKRSVFRKAKEKHSKNVVQPLTADVSGMVTWDDFLDAGSASKEVLQHLANSL